MSLSEIPFVPSQSKIPFVVSLSKIPIMVSLSNHAFRGKVKTAEISSIPPRAWFDRLTTNGF
jgi:hypothetical protein